MRRNAPRSNTYSYPIGFNAFGLRFEFRLADLPKTGEQIGEQIKSISTHAYISWGLRIEVWSRSEHQGKRSVIALIAGVLVRVRRMAALSGINRAV